MWDTYVEVDKNELAADALRLRDTLIILSMSPCQGKEQLSKLKQAIPKR